MTRSRFGSAILILALCITLGAVSSAVNRQSLKEVHDCSGLWFYDHALERLFSWAKIDGQKEGRVIVFRILPTFAGESQVVIREQKNGQSQVIYYELFQKPSDHGLYRHIEQLCSVNKNTTVDDAVRGTRVRIKVIDPSSELLRAIREMPEINTPANIANNVIVDTPVYDLWVDSGAGNLHLRTLEGGSLSTWMVEVTKLAQSAPGRVIAWSGPPE
jgi:hypothetical protein